MTTIIHGSRNRVRLIHEIAFSVYFPLLLILVNSIRSAQHPARPSWINEFQLLIAGNKGAYSYYYLAFVILWVSSAAVLFFCLRLAARLSLSDVFLRSFAGLVAVLGFPVAVAYVTVPGYMHMFGSFPRAILYAYAPHLWLGIEVAIALVCIFLYVFLKWPVHLGLLLLVSHFLIWTALASLGREKSLLVYPLFGFLASLAWGGYVNQSREGRRNDQSLAVPTC